MEYFTVHKIDGEEEKLKFCNYKTVQELYKKYDEEYLELNHNIMILTAENRTMKYNERDLDIKINNNNYYLVKDKKTINMPIKVKHHIFKNFNNIDVENNFKQIFCVDTYTEDCDDFSELKNEYEKLDELPSISLVTSEKLWNYIEYDNSTDQYFFTDEEKVKKIKQK